MTANENPPRRRRDTAPLLFPSQSDLDPLRMKLEEVAAFVEVVARCDLYDREDRIHRDRLLVAVAAMRRVLARWDAAGAVTRGQDLSGRWRDVGALGDACVTVALAAAGRRGDTAMARLRDVAFYLAEVEPDRLELLPAALALAWAAGIATRSVAPNEYQEVIDSVLMAIGLAATLADLNHPAQLRRWRSESTIGLD